jgi:hypothetical protein
MYRVDIIEMTVRFFGSPGRKEGGGVEEGFGLRK